MREAGLYLRKIWARNEGEKEGVRISFQIKYETPACSKTRGEKVDWARKRGKRGSPDRTNYWVGYEENDYGDTKKTAGENIRTS